MFGSAENKRMQDQEVIREFLVESHENLSRLDQEFVELEKHPKDAALLASIFRTIHTIKGTCGFLANVPDWQPTARPPWHLILASLALLACQLAPGQTAGNQPDDDYANKSIEELMNIPVNSVARKDQKLSKSPAAVYVITEEAIQRSGATIIPDLLRAVPGVQVAEAESNRWAISVRGFNGIYSDKLLVLVDGRTVYAPSFSGVYWDQLLAIPLDTIERIEVVRGPGGALWGANAVNGVINIITKSSKESQGTQLVIGSGSAQTSSLQARYGGTVGQWGTYRVIGQYEGFAERPGVGTAGPARDGLHFGSGGFRLDSGPAFSSKDSFYAEGNFFQADAKEILTSGATNQSSQQPLYDQGFDVTARWTHKHSDSSESSLQIFDNHYQRYDFGLQEHSNTLDFDFQNHTAIGSRNDVVWGANYRFTDSSLRTAMDPESAFETLGYLIRVVPVSQKYSLFGTFLQDEIRLTDNLSFTAGAKLEHNAFSGFGYEPNLRLAWSNTSRSTFWAAASQSLRQPSVRETALRLQTAPITAIPQIAIDSSLSGNTGVVNERVRDFEGGYRVIPADRLSFDVTGFYSTYRDLLSSYLDPPSLVPQAGGLHLTIPWRYANGASARDYGAEFTSNWNVVPRWKLTGSYSWARSFVRSEGDFSQATPGPLTLLPPAMQSALIQGFLASLTGNSATLPPQHQIAIQSFVDVSKRLSFDNSLYFVGRLNIGVPAYTRFDSRLSYHFNPHLEARIIGQNLLEPQHIEFANASPAAVTLVPRSVFVELRWTF